MTKSDDGCCGGCSVAGQLWTASRIPDADGSSQPEIVLAGGPNAVLVSSGVVAAFIVLAIALKRRQSQKEGLQ